MMKFLLASLTALTFALSTACATNSGASADAAATAISAAKASAKQASSVGAEWRDTGKMIKKAEELAAEGKTDAAIKEAKKAEMQGKAAYTQITETEAKNIGPRF